MLRLLQWYFRHISRLLPETSARLAARLFLTPQRYAIQSEAGRGLLASAERETRQGLHGDVCVRRWRPKGGSKAGSRTAPRVLLLHGWSDRAANLGDLIDRLLRQGFDVTAPDLPGHGDSAGRLTHMRDWMTFLRDLSRNNGPWHAVVGHSLGGFAAAAAVRRDLRQYGDPVETDRLVLIAPPNGSLDMLHIFGDILHVPPSIRLRTEWELSRIIKADFAAFSTAQALAGFAGEALVLHDRDDQRVPFTHFETIRRTAPSQQFHVTEGLGHRRILADSRVLDRISEFLDDGGVQVSRSATG